MTNVQWATEALGRDIAPEPTASEWLNGGRWTVEELDEAEVEFAFQVDRKGSLTATKTDGSARTVPIPQQLARILVEHKQRSSYVAPTNFVFCTRTGRPFSQRNIARALRAAQFKATTPAGEPTFPALHVLDERGELVPPPHGAIPSMHSFRHTVASRALLAGESVDEIAFLLGHRDANVTRAVYVREVADARRRRCVDRKWSRSSRTCWVARRSTDACPR